MKSVDVHLGSTSIPSFTLDGGLSLSVPWPLDKSPSPPPRLSPAGHCFLFMGIQAAGKTTFYRTFLAASYAHISLDIQGTRRREKDLFAQCLRDKVSVAVDDTNLTKEVRAMFLAPARHAGYHITGLYFRSVIADCVARNALRAGKACVPSHAIAASSKKLELPALEEGFDDLWYVSLDENFWRIAAWRAQ